MKPKGPKYSTVLMKDDVLHRPWRKPRVSFTTRIAHEVEHHINVMMLHYGISKNAVVTHAIQRMWADCLDMMSHEDLDKYEDQLARLKLYNLKRSEMKAKKKKLAFLKQVDALKRKIKERDPSEGEEE